MQWHWICVVEFRHSWILIISWHIASGHLKMFVKWEMVSIAKRNQHISHLQPSWRRAEERKSFKSFIILQCVWSTSTSTLIMFWLWRAIRLHSNVFTFASKCMDFTKKICCMQNKMAVHNKYAPHVIVEPCTLFSSTLITNRFMFSTCIKQFKPLCVRWKQPTFIYFYTPNFYVSRWIYHTFIISYHNTCCAMKTWTHSSLLY